LRIITLKLRILLHSGAFCRVRIWSKIHYQPDLAWEKRLDFPRGTPKRMSSTSLLWVESFLTSLTPLYPQPYTALFVTSQ